MVHSLGSEIRSDHIQPNSQIEVVNSARYQERPTFTQRWRHQDTAIRNSADELDLKPA